MKTRQVVASVVVGLSLAPVVAFGAVLLIPAALVMLAVLSILAVPVLLALILGIARTTEPTVDHPHGTMPATGVYSS